MKKFGKTRKHCNFVDHTEALHANAADSVQWLSQSDYSICISTFVEFYKNSVETQNWRDLLTNDDDEEVGKAVSFLTKRLGKKTRAVSGGS